MTWDDTAWPKFDCREDTDDAEEWDIWITSDWVKRDKPPTDDAEEE